MEPDVAAGGYFAPARTLGAIGLFLAGALAIAGASLHWISVVERPEVVEGADFGEGREPEVRVSEPFTGLEDRDGWWVTIGGAVLIGLGAWLLTRRRGAWLALFVSVVIGGIAFADYRGVSSVSSPISRRHDIVGGTEPGIGLTIVTAAALVGVIASVIGIAATPGRPTARGSRNSPQR